MRVVCEECGGAGLTAKEINHLPSCSWAPDECNICSFSEGHAKWCTLAPENLRAPAEPSGAKLEGDHYYRVRIPKPMSPEVEPYVAECGDIIEALDLTFNEGELFKAVWRLAKNRKGRGKAGTSVMYDAEKVAHYGQRVLEHTRVKNVLGDFKPRER